jgi:hypothetical protein
MLTPEERQTVAGFTRTLQIIVLALCGGVTSYLLFVVFAMPAPAGDGRTMSLLGVVFAASVVSAAAVVPRIIGAQQRSALVNDQSPANDAARLLGDFQVRRIITAALLEGGAFFNVFAYQMERQAFTLGIVLALLLGLVMLVPLRPSVEQWLERELRTVKELRQLQR